MLSEYWMLGDRVRHSFISSEWQQCAFVDNHFILGDKHLENLKAPMEKTNLS